MRAQDDDNNEEQESSSQKEEATSSDYEDLTADLISLPLEACHAQSVEELKTVIVKKREELKKLEETSATSLWTTDLDELEKKYYVGDTY